MTKRASFGTFYHGLILVMFYAALFVLVFASILQGADESFLGIPLSPAFIMRIRTIGSVLLIIYLLLLLPVSTPLNMVIAAASISLVSWAAGYIAISICNIIPETMVVGFLVGMFFFALMGIFMIFFLWFIASVVGHFFMAASVIMGVVLAACLALPGMTDGSNNYPYKHLCRYLAFAVSVILIVTSGLWYGFAWNHSNYSKGKALAAKEDYEQAAMYLGRCGHYKDAFELWDQYSNIYLADKADAAMSEGDYEAAAILYSSAEQKGAANEAKILAAKESGDLLSVADELLGYLANDNLKYADEALEMIRNHPELFTPGDTYYMGRYIDDEGKEKVMKWLVLSEDEDSLRVLSWRNLPKRQMDADDSVEFAKSDLYEYLNHEFLYETFTEEEIAIMYTPEEYYYSHPAEYSWPVFLPAERDIDYLESQSDLRFLLGDTWWLRDQRYSLGECSTSFVKADGSIGSGPNSNKHGIRPVLMIKK